MNRSIGWWLVAVAIASCSSAIPGTDTAARVLGVACNRDTVGSAIHIAPGTLLTNAHVVAGTTDPLRVVRPDGEELHGIVTAIDPVRDLALVTVTGLDGTPVPLGSADAGDTGFIVAMNNDNALTPISYTVRRRITANSGDIYDEGEYQRQALDLDATIDPGMSGAGLLDGDGDLVGLVFAESRENPVTYAIDAAEIEAFLAESAPQTVPVDTGRCS